MSYEQPNDMDRFEAALLSKKCICELCECKQGRDCPIVPRPTPFEVHELVMFAIGVLALIVMVIV